ncbi:hypothetical protein NSND_60170 [Nitrospira sp. ND1]|nr:hypothetical protein NSND_60170 [Nitrospira sp. ND1]
MSTNPCNRRSSWALRLHVRVGSCGGQYMQNLLGIPVGSDGDEYIAPVYRLLLMMERGFR